MTKKVTFAAALTRLRTAANLSIPDLAAAAGLPRQTVHMLERGEREPSLLTARKLCRALRCSLSEFDPIS